MASSGFSSGEWKEADSTLLAKYQPAPPTTYKTIVDKNGRVMDLVPRMPIFEEQAWSQDTRHNRDKHFSPTRPSTSVVETPPCLNPPLKYSVWSSLIANTDMRIIMVGLKDAGKTTILNQVRLNLCQGGDNSCDVKTTNPTAGFNVETLEYKKISITAWDLEDEDKFRPLWRRYFHNIQGIIFVVDSSSDLERIKEAGDELLRIMNEDELRDAKILVFENKVDVTGSWDPPHVMAYKLGLSDVGFSRDWHIASSSANKGHGLDRGLQWLSNNIANKVRWGLINFI